MINFPLTVPVNPETAQAFLALSDEDRRNMEILLGLYLKRLVFREPRSLLEIADEIGRQAEANGMTPEILQSILDEE
jgi:hypothetical protein